MWEGSQLPLVAQLGEDRLPRILSRSESIELKAMWDPSEPQAWPACKRLLSLKAPAANTGGGKKKAKQNKKHHPQVFSACGTWRDDSKPQSQHLN